jgi:hypothetical protein
MAKTKVIEMLRKTKSLTLLEKYEHEHNLFGVLLRGQIDRVRKDLLNAEANVRVSSGELGTAPSVD